MKFSKALRYMTAGFLMCAGIGGFSINTYATESTPSSWAVSEIDSLLEQGAALESFMTDYQGYVSKEQYLELLVKTYESVTGLTISVPEDIIGFNDCDYEHVLKAKTLGWVMGDELNNLNPTVPMTKEEALTLMARMIESVESAFGKTMALEKSLTFEDESEIASWAVEAIQKLKSLGLIGGDDNNHLNPKHKISSEVALILNGRLIKHFEANNLVVPDYLDLFATYEGMARSKEITFHEEPLALAPLTQEAYVVADILNVRSGPDTQASQVTKIKYGTNLEIIKSTGEWYLVRTGSTEGYVHKDYVKFKSQTTDVRGLRQEVIAYASKFIGTRYRYAGNSLTGGVDCSHFTMLVLKEFGYNISPGSRSQATQGVAIGESDLQPGDLVIYGYSKGINHVAMYLGDGKIIHATRSYGVAITPMRGFLSQQIKGFRRIIQ